LTSPLSLWLKCTCDGWTCGSFNATTRYPWDVSHAPRIAKQLEGAWGIVDVRWLLPALKYLFLGLPDKVDKLLSYLAHYHFGSLLLAAKPQIYIYNVKFIYDLSSLTMVK
jgi:hypothetical protein